MKKDEYEMIAAFDNAISAIYEAKEAALKLYRGKNNNTFDANINTLESLVEQLKPSTVNILASRTPMGKSTLAVNMLTKFAEMREKSVVFFSIEMKAAAITRKMVGLTSGVDINRIGRNTLSDNEREKVSATLRYLKSLKIDIVERVGINQREMENVLSYHDSVKGPLGLVVIDCLQLIPIIYEGGDAVANLKVISELLQGIARKFKVPVLITSQVNFEVEYKNDKRPRYEDLGNLYPLIDDADLVMTLYRDDIYYKDSPDQGLAEVTILKNKHGGTGTVKLRYEGEFGKFTNTN